MREKIANPVAGPTPGTRVRSVSAGPASALWALISAYGSMYLVRSITGNLLLVAASMMNPIAGMAGLACGACALAIRWALGLAPRAGNIDILNAALVGVYLGAVFAPTP